MRKRPPNPSTGRLPVLSSDTTGTPGMSLASPARMTVSDASSAAVTGERIRLVALVQVELRHRQDGCGRARGDQRQAVEQPGNLGFRRHKGPIPLQPGCDLSHRPLTLDARIA